MALDIMGIHEIAEFIKMDDAYVAVLHQRGKLPAHDATVGNGRTKVWRRSTIVKWNTKHGPTWGERQEER